MEGSSHFRAPIQESDALTFKPITNLPPHLKQYGESSAGIRHKMTPIMQAILALTDKSCLRSAALPQNN